MKRLRSQTPCTDWCPTVTLKVGQSPIIHAAFLKKFKSYWPPTNSPCTDQRLIIIWIFQMIKAFYPARQGVLFSVLIFITCEIFDSRKYGIRLVCLSVFLFICLQYHSHSFHGIAPKLFLWLGTPKKLMGQIEWNLEHVISSIREEFDFWAGVYMGDGGCM